MSSPHPELETLAQLADPALSTLSESELAAAREHVLTCLECAADVEALRAVQAELGGLPAVTIPADLAARLDAALDAVVLDGPTAEIGTVSTGSAAGPGSTGSTVTTLDAARSARRRWRPMPTSIAAGVAVLVFAALATAVALGSHGSSKSSSASSAASSVPRAAAGAIAPANQLVISSGTDYTTADFRTQIGAVLLSRVPSVAPFVSSSAAFPASAPAASAAASAAEPSSAAAAASSAPAAATSAAPESFAADATPSSAAATTANAPDAAGSPLATAGWPLATGTALQTCLDYLSGAPGTKPVLVDHAVFDGKPATIITLHDPQISSQLDVYVIDDSISCESGNVTYAAFLHAS